MESIWEMQHQPSPCSPAPVPQLPVAVPSPAQAQLSLDTGCQQRSSLHLIHSGLRISYKAQVQGGPRAARLVNTSSAVNNVCCFGPPLCARCFIQVVHTLCLVMSEGTAPPFIGTQDICPVGSSQRGRL